MLNLEGERTSATSRQVFVVDDDEDVCDLLEAVLGCEGFPVTSFADGDALLRALGPQPPVCVFLDLVMPRRSGLEILKELRGRQFWAPVVMMSARDDTPLVVEAMKSGALDYLTKPFERHAPTARVREALDVWSCRVPGDGTVPAYAVDSDEWVKVSPSEKGALSLMRLMDFAQK